MNYTELVSEDRDALFLIFNQEDYEEYHLRIENLCISDGKIKAWSAWTGDDPEDVDCQEDYYKRIFLEIKRDNPLFTEANELQGKWSEEETK